MKGNRQAGRPYQVVFLCTGNICRSPMAEGVLRHELSSGGSARVMSAGVGALPGYAASEHSVTACGEIGIDIGDHRSQPCTPALLAEADLVLAMEMHHQISAQTMAPEHAERIHLLSRYAAGDPNASPLGVSDPIGGDLDEYREALTLIREYIKNALPRIEREIEAAALEA